VQRLSDAGRLPAPVHVGCLTRWRRDELERWVRAGCPAVGTDTELRP
jgi:predicted DNA-binding transcriptional regulator AlpA